MDWSIHFPKYFPSPSGSDQLETFSSISKRVEFADIGCGFGGLLMALAPLFPDTLMLGEYHHRLVYATWHKGFRHIRDGDPGYGYAVRG